MAERIKYLTIQIDDGTIKLLNSTATSYDVSSLAAGDHTAKITAICKEHGSSSIKTLSFTVAGSSSGGGDSGGDSGNTGGGDSGNTGGGTTRAWSVLVWDNTSNATATSDDVTLTVAGSKATGTYICIDIIQTNDYFQPGGSGNYVLRDSSETVTINGTTWKIAQIEGHSWESGDYTEGNFGTYYCNQKHNILMLDNKLLNAASTAEIKAYAD